MTDIYTKRQELKERYDKYRKAARRITGGKVSDLSTPVEIVDQSGAFVEVNIWVPKEEMEKEL